MSEKKKFVRKGLMWLVKPTLWRNKWNVDQAVNPDSPAGMQVSDFRAGYDLLKQQEEKERALKTELEKKLEHMSATEAFAYYVNAEKLSDEYLDHRRRSLRVKGWVSYALCLGIAAFAILQPNEGGLLSLLGKILPFVLVLAFSLHGIQSFYRAEQILQRRMFHIFEMFENPIKLIF